MGADLLPFLVVQLARFIEDVGVHGQLAHVVEQRRPAQAVPVGLREVELVGDHVGEGPDPLGVAPGLAVVAAKRGGQRQDLLGHGQGHRRLGPGGARAGLGPAFEVPGQARPPGHLHALGGPVGEEHGHLQQGGQRQEAPAQPLGADEGYRRRGQHHGPPQDLAGQAVPVGQGAAGRHRGGDGHGEGHSHSPDGQDGTEHGVGPPPVRPGHLGLRRRGRRPGPAPPL